MKTVGITSVIALIEIFCLTNQMICTWQAVRVNPLLPFFFLKTTLSERTDSAKRK